MSKPRTSPLQANPVREDGNRRHYEEYNVYVYLFSTVKTHNYSFGFESGIVGLLTI